MNEDILIVEDSPMQRLHLKSMLLRNGFTVREAENGRDALSLLQETTPALIITDIVMPEMDGYAFCATVKRDAHLRRIPLMLLTQLSNPKDIIKGLQAGADNFITKPFDEQFLLGRIRYMLINAEVRREPHHSGLNLQIMFGGEEFTIDSERIQIIDLLLSTYETAVQKSTELEDAYEKLTLAHRELKAQKEQLEKLNEDKTNFLRIAAHDVRNPVGTILGYSSLLLEDKRDSLDAEALDWLRIINEGSEFILKLLNELLDIAVIESGELHLNRDIVDLTDLVRRNARLNAVTADRKGIAITVVHAGDPIMADIDGVKIEQVLNNLITNAVKFSRSGTTVTIGIAANDSEVVISVADEGQGIPAAELDRLFQPFAKISVRSTGGERSTGLGLSIVRRIVEAHGGRIWVDSEVNVGSTFHVALPLR